MGCRANQSLVRVSLQLFLWLFCLSLVPSVAGFRNGLDLLECRVMKTRTFVVMAAAVASWTVACGKPPASPFDRLKDAPITVFRLQNYEPPPTATATGAPTQPGAMPTIPGIPPEIQTWIQQGAQGMGALIPPGLIPPGLIPGLPAPGGATPPAAAPPQDAPRFEGFRILGQPVQVMDPKIRDQIIEVLGYENSFEDKRSPCLYPELGISFNQGPNMPPADVLISFSCKQAQGRNFQWPFAVNGLTKETVQKFTTINQQLFTGG